MKRYLATILVLGAAIAGTARAEHAESNTTISGPNGTVSIRRSTTVRATAPYPAPYNAPLAVGGAYVSGPGGGAGVVVGPRGGYVAYGFQRPYPGAYATGYAYPPYSYAYGSPSSSWYINPYWTSTSGSSCYPSLSSSSYGYGYGGTYPRYGSATFTPTYGYGSGSWGGSFSYSRVPGQSFSLNATGPYGGTLSIRAMRSY